MAASMVCRLETCFHNIKPINLLNKGVRRFHISSCLDVKKDLARKQANIMSRLIAKSGMSKNKKKTWFLNTTVQPQPQGRGPSAGMVRRSEYASSVLSEYIIRTLQNGELGPELSTVTISKVKVLPDFGSVNVSWQLTGTDQDVELEKLLKERAPTLRYTLQTKQLFGNIPPILFIKDKSRLNVIEVEKLLQVADFGDDYVPQEGNLELCLEQRQDTNSAYKKRKDIHLSTDSDKDIYCSDSSNIAEPLDHSGPEFRQDLYGLQHDQIMEKLTEGRSDTKFQEPVTNLDTFSKLPKRNRKEAIDMYAKLLRRKNKSEKKMEYSYSDYIQDLEQESEN